ncbi:MAG: hypothetical protein CMP23_17305, partial [Rickettsiales bacterium]|nr:hypothetical protein [Rickettsiales bacterium]
MSTLRQLFALLTLAALWLSPGASLLAQDSTEQTANDDDSAGDDDDSAGDDDDSAGDDDDSA